MGGTFLGGACGHATNLLFILLQRSIFGISTPMTQHDIPRYAVGLSEDGLSWTVIDHSTGGYVPVKGGFLTLADEEQAGHWAELLNGVDKRQAQRGE
ncbi:hypothetical protein [Azospirillum canadense]|uniref:hypothetical protein n=1 Tax=Azospirillum canadense TaxID=403962 RepID=UPI002226FDEE|nr:hypothetical protein [Azospirillum canadense]MCW2243615.1 hypothetical protein [Azospirillum canadense]